MPLPALAPIVSSVLGAEGMASVATTFGLSALTSNSQTIGAGVTNTAAQFNGPGRRAPFIPPMPGTGAAAGSLAEGFLENLRDSMNGLDQFYDKLELASSALTGFSAGGVNMFRRPTSSVIGTFEAQLEEAISGKGLPTATAQRAADQFFKFSGMEMVSKIPIIGALPSIGKDFLDSIIQLPNAIEKWGEALLASRFKLARWNASMAGTQIEAERREILRDISSARATAGSTKELNRAVQDLKDTMRPLNDTMINGFNMVVANLTRGLDKIVQQSGEIANSTYDTAVGIPIAGKQIQRIADVIDKYLGTGSSSDSRVFPTFMMKMMSDQKKNPQPKKNSHAKGNMFKLPTT